MNRALRILFLIVGVASLAMLGCDREEGGVVNAPPATGPVARASDSEPKTAAPPRVVFLGDSLTAGLGVDADQAFPALLGEMLRDDNGINVTVVNAGVSGDTTAGGLRRIDWLLRQKPDVLVVGLGGNDGLRGLEVAASEQNLREIVDRAQAANVKVLLLGMQMPPNYGPEYTSRFREIYARVARERGVSLVPFMLEGVGGDASLNQPDGIHPTAEGHRRIAATLLPHLRDLLQSAEPPPTGQSSRN